MELIYKLNRGYKGIIIKAVTAFYTILLGVKVIYNRHWLYRDLKPTNIGLISKPLHSVLLNIGIFRYIQAGKLLQLELDTVSTISYLAPKFKLKDYNHSINIQSMGIILFKLIYNYYLQKFPINLQRDGKITKNYTLLSRKVIKILLIKQLGIIRVYTHCQPKAIYIISISYCRTLITCNNKQAYLNLQSVISLLKQ